MSNSRYEYSAAVNRTPNADAVLPNTDGTKGKAFAIANPILIIDDSNRICSILVTGIVNHCSAAGYNCRIIQSSELGLIPTLPIEFGINLPATANSNIQPNRPSFTIFTANSPRNALPVLRQPGIRRLTIISDIMMPADTEVGLVGMLDELARRALPVNLVFTSSESQNRDYVVSLIKNGKAFFLEKGTENWAGLPYALVNHTDHFSFKTIVTGDFDNGMLRGTQSRKDKNAGGSSFPPLRWIANLIGKILGY